MLAWAEAIDSLADESGFAGVVSVDRGGEIEFGRAYGLADRSHQIPNTLDTRFAIASGTKGLTALTVVSLISDGVLRLSMAARPVLGEDLPLIGEDVTVEHLLAHRSGIGDYLDEEAGHEVTDYVLTVPAHRSVHDPGPAVTHTVISNSSYGAWPVAGLLDELLGG
jgi:CubicO group peptidase (beta-lactamase class C family)